MQELITDFTLRSSIRRITHDTQDRYKTEASGFHDHVISDEWDLINTPEVLNQTADTEQLLELLRNDEGCGDVEEKGLIDGFRWYEVQFSNISFHILQLPRSYRVSAAQPLKKARYLSCFGPEETLARMHAFNNVIPELHDSIEKEVAQVARDNMLGEMTAATGKGVIDQLIAEEGLQVPPISCISGTANGRVIIYFADSSEKISCPLNYLRARLLKRFGQKRSVRR